jgi:hypothetical protein
MSDKKKTSVSKAVTPRVRLVFPHLTEADEFKGVRSFKTKAVLSGDDPKTDAFIAKVEEEADAAYSAAVEKLEDKVANGKGREKAKAKEALGKLEKFMPIEPVYDDDGEETGDFIFNSKLNEEGKNPNTGKTWKNKVNLVDAKGKAITKKVSIWGNTIAKLSLELVPFHNDATNQAGVSLRLVGVQIIELVSGGSGRSAESMGFEEEDGFSADDIEEFEDEDESEDAAEEDEDADADEDF